MDLVAVPCSVFPLVLSLLSRNTLIYSTQQLTESNPKPARDGKQGSQTWDSLPTLD